MSALDVMDEDYDRDMDFQDDIECLEKENAKLKEEVKRLKDYVRALKDKDRAWGNMYCELSALQEALVGALKGVEPSDFMLSFPEVRMAWDLWLVMEDWRERGRDRDFHQ